MGGGEGRRGREGEAGVGGSDSPPQGWLQLREELKAPPAQPILLDGWSIHPLFFLVGGMENAEERAPGLGSCKAKRRGHRGRVYPADVPHAAPGTPAVDRGAVQKSQHTVSPDRPQQTAHPCRPAHRALLAPDLLEATGAPDSGASRVSWEHN